jgi:membrane protein YdbS with pleckstrin-like domain
MNVQQILRWIVVAIVLIVAVSLFSVILKVGAMLLSVALKILLVLLLVAIVLRFVGVAQQRRRRY